jgi:heme oxygenase
MSLKDLTWKYHQDAERTEHARKLLLGMSPNEYHRYLFNQYHIYVALEYYATKRGVLTGIEEICRGSRIHDDIDELNKLHKLNDPVVCDVVSEYVDYVEALTNPNDILAHIYVRHFGDMYGGQIISKRNPGSGKMYEFDNVEALKTTVRAKLSDDMADEANRCFQFAIQLFKELSNE